MTYTWTPKDKLLYLLSMIPFLAAVAGTLVVLKDFALYITLIWISLYLLVNFFQAGCCIGCPYRGKYCPALVGVYLGNFMSKILYPKRKHDPKFFELNAAGGEISLTIFLLFPVYWLFITQWWYVPIYLVLILAHMLIFMPLQCPKCSYNNTCPGGKAYQGWKKMFCRKLK